MKEKETPETDLALSELLDHGSKQLAQVVAAIDSLAFAVAGQGAIDAPRLARQLKAEAKRLQRLKTGNELAIEIVLRMEKNVLRVSKKRGRRVRQS